MPKHLLLVDDEPINLELMAELLEDAGYQIELAHNGEEAWEILNDHGNRFSTILLDKMMPGISGTELLKRIKANEELAFLPVVMQTAVGEAASVQESLASGAFYYLTKPFSRDMLLAVVGAATEHWDRHQYFTELANQHLEALHHMTEANFRFGNLLEARSVTALLARASKTPDKTATGLFELIVNAIEHGNLELSYEEKSRLQMEDRWVEVLQQRMEDPVLGQRKVEVTMQRHDDTLRYTIRDQGPGFDWQNYLQDDPGRLVSSHGRGILIARKLSFDSVEYEGRGNCVHATLKGQ